MNIWIDGSGALNPGQKARYCIVFENGETVVETVESGSNNEMEYFALLQALRDKRSIDSTIHTDSRLLVGQLTLEWKVNADNLRKFHEECKRLLIERNAKVVWVPRTENKAGKVLESRISRTD